ncbi:PREDICTED: uncharacterized protein LOC108609795 [Drosophila arizonae]|uniref:Uncharacterized protein LOC108609795 n=1 Tax=Drosophila arizonae TaxID=7263 RepID=A0ABM1NPZ7_DROAR|nr:PREDICTED: uncharacterized protein LOC108609795 [Drosophila arizonae]
MSLSTALMPQQRPQCNRKSAQIFARFFEQRYGNWSCMRNRGICRSAQAVVEQQVQQVRCVDQQLGTFIQTQQRGSFVALQRNQLLALHREDYRIYPQSVDLDSFFSEQEKCDKVSDVCLLNDHFILVKMPQQEPEQGQKLAQLHHVPELNVPQPEQQRKLSSRLPRCFKCNRSNRVSPILEELEETEPVGYRPWIVHGDDDVEVFSSTTRIIPVHSKQEMQAISLPTHTAGEDSAVVEQPLPKLQLETLQTSPPAAVTVSSHPISRGPFHWFLWPFRRRLQRRKAPLAAVHKTYFITWKKPPETLWRGYGVDRAVADKVALRRCRSAIF